MYQNEAVTEQFRCNYGLNPNYQAEISRSGLQIAGIDLAGEVRIVELPRHRFFMATLFLPQLSSTPERPHPLILAYLKAAVAFRTATLYSTNSKRFYEANSENRKPSDP
jgi:CTP synthase (UTP-ammonia lyase)